MAYNDQSFLPYTAPAWFRKVTADPPLVTAVATAFDYHNGSQRATPTCEPALEQVRRHSDCGWYMYVHTLDLTCGVVSCLQCSESLPTVIMARGLPGAPGLAVPLYPDTNAEPPFTKTSAMVYFTAPAKDGLLVDRWRVEWATEATFSVLTTQVPLLTPLSLPPLSPSITHLGLLTTQVTRPSPRTFL